MNWPATKDLIVAVLPLVAVVLAGLAPSRYEPVSPFLANQRWRYRELIVVLSAVTASEFVSLPVLAEVTGIRPWAIDGGAVAVLITASVWGVVRWNQRRPWRALGFEPSTACYNVLWALRIALAIEIVLMSFMLLVGLDAPGPGRTALQIQIGDFTAALLITAILAPVAEETFYRGLAYGPLFRKFGPAGAAVGSAALWAMAHFSEVSYASMLKISFMLIVGIVYAEIYRRRQSLVPTLVFHIVANTTALFIGTRHVTTVSVLLGVSAGLWMISVVVFRAIGPSRSTTVRDGEREILGS